MAHDAYNCRKDFGVTPKDIVFEYGRPFPTKRGGNFQHVGQVFDAEERPRLADIERFTRNRPTPSECRKKSEWKFG